MGKPKVQITQEEQQLVKELVEHPGMAIVAREFKKYGRDAFVKKNLCNPLDTPGKYYEYDALHRTITILMPQLIECLVNYEEAAPDKQVEPKKRWSILDWFRK